MIRKFLILLLLLVAATASLAVCLLTLGPPVWRIGDASLITSRYTVAMERYDDLAWVDAGWRGRWRPLTREKTTSASMCGVDTSWSCTIPGDVDWVFWLGPAYVGIQWKEPLRGRTDCSKRSRMLRVPEVSDGWVELPYYAPPTWEANRLRIEGLARLPQARRSLGAIAILSAAYPLLVLIRGPLRRLRRRRRRLCLTCAYNLTGNTSGRCPECGTLLQSV